MKNGATEIEQSDRHPSVARVLILFILIFASIMIFSDESAAHGIHDQNTKFVDYDGRQRPAAFDGASKPTSLDFSERVTGACSIAVALAFLDKNELPTQSHSRLRPPSTVRSAQGINLPPPSPPPIADLLFKSSSSLTI